jgi:hypothetical protein
VSANPCESKHTVAAHQLLLLYEVVEALKRVTNWRGGSMITAQLLKSWLKVNGLWITVSALLLVLAVGGYTPDCLSSP